MKIAERVVSQTVHKAPARCTRTFSMFMSFGSGAHQEALLRWREEQPPLVEQNASCAITSFGRARTCRGPWSPTQPSDTSLTC